MVHRKTKQNKKTVYTKPDQTRQPCSRFLKPFSRGSFVHFFSCFLQITRDDEKVQSCWATVKLQYETAPLHKNPVDRLFTKVLLVVNINDLQCTKMLFFFLFFLHMFCQSEASRASPRSRRHTGLQATYTWHRHSTPAWHLQVNKGKDQQHCLFYVRIHLHTPIKMHQPTWLCFSFSFFFFFNIANIWCESARCCSK